MPDPDLSTAPWWTRSRGARRAAGSPNGWAPSPRSPSVARSAAAPGIAVAEALPHAETGMPWATLLVNVSGAFVLAALLVLVLDLWPPRRYVRPFLATGFLGAYTTFSSLAVEVDQRLADGAIGTATSYLALTLVAGLGAGWFGLLVGQAVVRRNTGERPS